jgi:hypothetical protein
MLPVALHVPSPLRSWVIHLVFPGWAVPVYRSTIALLRKPLLFALVEFLAVEGTFPKCRILPLQAGNNAVGVVGGSAPIRARHGEQVLGFVGHYCDCGSDVWTHVVIRWERWFRWWSLVVGEWADMRF